MTFSDEQLVQLIKEGARESGRRIMDPLTGVKETLEMQTQGLSRQNGPALRTGRSALRSD
ncbi:MAG TPA: hypothetical protein VMH81_11060 [Bryobacteraceae bacterium]|nr:hypothetical protein [Bryobacteraceae bacterium]